MLPGLHARGGEEIFLSMSEDQNDPFSEDEICIGDNGNDDHSPERQYGTIVDYCNGDGEGRC